jgi:hypothetical protein
MPSSDRALCAVHPEVLATFTCSRCGSFGCEPCKASTNQAAMCKACLPRSTTELRWERAERLALPAAYFVTVWQSLTSPIRFFAEARTVSTGRALVFATVSSVVAALPGSVHYLITEPDSAVLHTYLGTVELLEHRHRAMALITLAWLLTGCATYVVLWTIGMSAAAKRRPTTEMLRLACYSTAPLPLLMLLQTLGVPGLWVGGPLLGVYGSACARFRFQCAGWLGAVVAVVAAMVSIPAAFVLFGIFKPLLARGQTFYDRAWTRSS